MKVMKYLPSAAEIYLTQTNQKSSSNNQNSVSEKNASCKNFNDDIIQVFSDYFQFSCPHVVPLFLINGTLFLALAILSFLCSVFSIILCLDITTVLLIFHHLAAHLLILHHAVLLVPGCLNPHCL